MLFGETVAVCCENHMEHIDTLCGQKAVYIVAYLRHVGIVTSKHALAIAE
jgi:hypothetical protein